MKTKAAGMRCAMGSGGNHTWKGQQKARHDNPFTFRGITHYMFDFNEQVTECLETVADEITK